MSNPPPPPPIDPANEGKPPSDDDAARLLEAGLSEPLSGPGRVPPQPPEVIQARFPELTIESIIGQGGMGVVYKATQRRLERPVALKVLPEELGQDPAFAERFLREARTLARLDHAHIVRVHDFGERDGLFYLLMEYVDGASLRQLMASGRMAPEEALAIVPQLCQALQYAHDEGVVHRDIKPENVLLDSRGQVKVADFGLAKMIQPDARDVTLTGTHQIMGTLHYMAPEQYRTPQDVDHRADIFSLGVVFYEMLTGDLPVGNFKQPSQTESMDQRIDAVVMRALEREREMRYQQASAVQQDVTRISQGAGGVAQGSVSSLRERREVRRRARRAAREAEHKTLSAAGLPPSKRRGLFGALGVPGFLASALLPIGFLVCVVTWLNVKPPTWAFTQSLEWHEWIIAKGYEELTIAGLIPWGAGVLLGLFGLAHGRFGPGARHGRTALTLVVIALVGCVVGLPIYAADREEAAISHLPTMRAFHERRNEERARRGHVLVKDLPVAPTVTRFDGTRHPAPHGILVGVQQKWDQLLQDKSGISPETSRNDVRLSRYYTQSQRRFIEELQDDDYESRKNRQALGLPLVDKAHWHHPPTQFEIQSIDLSQGEERAAVSAESGEISVSFWMMKEHNAWHFMVSDVQFMRKDEDGWRTLPPVSSRGGMSIIDDDEAGDDVATAESKQLQVFDEVQIVRANGKTPESAAKIHHAIGKRWEALVKRQSDTSISELDRDSKDLGNFFPEVQIDFLKSLESDEYNSRREGDLVGLPLVPRGRWPHPPAQFKLRRIVLEGGDTLATVRARSNDVELTFHMMLHEDKWEYMIGDVTFMDVDSGERR